MLQMDPRTLRPMPVANNSPDYALHLLTPATESRTVSNTAVRVGSQAATSISRYRPMALTYTSSLKI